MTEDFPLKRIRQILSPNTPPNASDMNMEFGSSANVLLQIRREHAEQSMKYRERCRETIVELLSVVRDAEMSPTNRIDIKAAILATDARCRFDRDPCLAIAKFALGTETGNEERRAQKYATVLRFLHSNNTYGEEAKKLLDQFGVEGLAALSREVHPKILRKKLKITFNRSDRLNVQLIDAVEGMGLPIFCRITAVAGGKVSCELDIHSTSTTALST